MVYLIGNRADLEEEREITKDDGLTMMNEMGLDHHMETSALTGMNIGPLFETLTKHLFLEHSGQLGEFKNDNGQ